MKNKKNAVAQKKGRPPIEKSGKTKKLVLKLYVAGQTPRSIAALANLRQVCEERVAGKYEIVVIDLIKKPQLASGDQILAVPTVVRSLPQPIRKIIGDLSNKEKLLIGLDIE